ncbi:cation diffusion facilitator family transporter [Natronobacillus azotifigens]|uniref:Cation diffusion facilitator family transporter n=1 Tax=Natronobacillus azotifigens TaxID=472978 RepID=A0A9J6RCJ0_9BACI|nr:cation diffusion facilitator family transporter [Natronobacillus azotifigens]MCZ0703229.1 cation diffusion facilitator family transporter [Natronobacillus azotifigens]
MKQNMYREQTVLKISVYGALIFSVAGILLGLIINSQIVLFDGLYSLISLGLSTLSLFAAKFMRTADWKNYPFGKDKIEPLVVLLKYFVILLLVVASLFSAIVAIFSGGREIAVGIALQYSFVATVLCVGTTIYLKNAANKSDSALIRAEANQWYMDSFVSIGVLAGFLISYIFFHIDSLRWTVPYIDPIMVVIVSIVFIKVPITEMGSSIREVLDMKPKGRVPNQIKAFVKELTIKYDFDEHFVRVSKVGKTLWVEVDFVVKNTDVIETLADQDQIRQEIHTFLDQYSKQKWLTVSFTEDRKWAL